MKTVNQNNNYKIKYYILLLFFLTCISIFSLKNFDLDELGFSVESYQIIGGDYTAYYLKRGQLSKALITAAKSYYFFWNYRPKFKPDINPAHEHLFDEEYKELISNSGKDPKKLIAPYPNRFRHGAGKPLLPALINIPFIAAANALAPSGKNYNYFQLNYNYHFAFFIARLGTIFLALATALIFYNFIKAHLDEQKTFFATSIFLLYPISIIYFPNIHHDSYAIPFILLSVSFFIKKRYILSGVFLGFAAACKNNWIFVLSAYFLFDVFFRSNENVAEKLKHAFFNNAVLLFFTIFTLSPFANPISYFEEILTPLIALLSNSTEIPAAVSTHLLEESLSRRFQSPPDRVQIRPFVLAIYAAGFFSLWGIFIYTTLLAALRLNLSQISYFSCCMIINLFPYQLLFLPELNYRYLLFIPFFAILISELINKEAFKVSVVLIIVIDLMLISDPISVNRINYNSDGTSLYEMITGLFG